MAKEAKEGTRRAGHAGVHLAGKQRVVFSPKSVLIAVDGDHGAMRIRNKAIPVDVVERGLEAGPLTLSHKGRLLEADVLHYVSRPLKQEGSETVVLFKLR